MESPIKFITDDDIPFEEDLIEDRLNQDVWVRYIHHKIVTTGGTSQPTLALLNRSVNHLCHSEKLWMMYLNSRTAALKNPSKGDIIQLQDIFFQASQYMNQKLGFWTLYLQFILDHLGYVKVTFARIQFDRALQCLPTIDHSVIWKLYLDLAGQVGGVTAFIINLSYCEFKFKTKDIDLSIIENESENSTKISTETALLTLMRTVSTIPQWKQLNRCFWELVTDHKFLVELESSEISLYEQFFDSFGRLVHLNQLELDFLDQQATAFFDRTRLKFSDQLGRFVVKYAEYWIERKQWARATSIFEEGMATSMTLKDFTVLYNSYVEFIDARVETRGDDVELLLKRYEDVLARRDLLVNDLYLRQDENNPQTWIERAKLFDPVNNKSQVRKCYQEAILTIKPSRVREKEVLPNLWKSYINFIDDGKTNHYEKLFNVAVKVPFLYVTDLEQIWCSWVDKKIERGDFDGAIGIAKRALTLPKGASKTIEISQIRYNDEEISPQIRIYKSIKMWSLYIDLLESTEDVAKVSEAYEQTFKLKIASPMTVLNYCNFLEEHKLYDRCLKIYDTGISIFRYPAVFEIWNKYLTKVVEFRGKLEIKNERIRELFDEALDGCPQKFLMSLYVAYANFEKDFGSKNQALNVLSTAIGKIQSYQEKIEIYKMLILWSSRYKGISSTGKMYQSALETLPVNTTGFIDDIVKGFVNAEAKQGELHKCRQILQYSCKLVMKEAKNEDVRKSIWNAYKEFELENGSENTYKQMLRFKRQLEDTAPPIVDETVDNTSGIEFVKSTAKGESKKEEEKADTNVENTDQIEINLDSMDI